MARLTLLRPRADGRWDWWRDDGAAGEGTPAEAAAAARGTRPVLVVPGETAQVHRVALPARRAAQLRAALPYALEERLADDVERLHFAAVRRGGEVLAAVVAQRDLAALLEALQGQGLRPVRAVPEPALLPAEAGTVTALLEPARAVVRTPEGGFALEREAAAALLARLAAEGRRLRLHLAPGAPPPDPAAQAEPLAGPPLAWMAPRAGTAPDLLQGRFGAEAHLAQVLRPWRAAAALLLVALAAATALRAVELARLEAAERALAARIETVFREALPEVRRMVDPEAQMRQQLEALRRAAGRGGGLLPLLAAAAPVLARDGVTVEGLRYRDGVLELDLAAPSLEAVEALRRRLAALDGLAAEVVSASRREDRVQGRLRLRGTA
ncbi:type II secretion system protein GspL [Inmirania thermothiophila]|uniref:Type II secretion system protein L n=1 Tax=Inmirania thermothiophila TaxID=1750597 RepID=A0A3N1XSD1_9GAMM|nr:type II secretion system protein GspL [Inmirania thermothiophila]ROR29563.1 general secretion pathway protein L [Inmirania thermothiophila]